MPRPVPSNGGAAALAAHLKWVGLGPVVFAAVSVVIVVVGMWWLLRAPSVPVEVTLPRAAGYLSTAPTGSVGGEGAALAPVAAPSSASNSTVSGRVVVHVAGSVARPGVYELPASGRINDAILVAGGPIEGAALDSLNLAAPLADGQRIYVPSRSEITNSVVTAEEFVTGGAGSGGGAQHESDGGSQVVPSGPLNINTADTAMLETLPGIGPSTAAAIVEDRQRNGPFATVDELDRVTGIGPAKLDAIRDLVTT